MQFGVSTWNFLKAYGERADLYAAVKCITRENFGVELWLDWPTAPELFERTQWESLKQICQNPVGLSLHSRLNGFFDLRILEEEIELCRFLEGDLLVVHPRSIGLDVKMLEYAPSAEPSESDIKKIVEIVRYARERGVCLALENGPFTVLKHVRDTIRVEGLDDHFGICLDTGHANLHRELHPSLLEDCFEEFHHDLLHLHLSDNHGNVDEHILPGEGNIDWSTVIPRLANLKLKGQIIFELNISGDPLISAKNARDFLLHLPQRSQRI